MPAAARSWVAGFAFLSMMSAGFSQGYYIVRSLGIGEAFVESHTGTVLMGGTTGSANDVLSAAQTIPFPFTFFGQSVTQYKVSDNGYITFDAAATTSVAINTTLPNASAPRNAIFVHWDDMELNTAATGTVDAIVNYTEGSAPNRIHVIQWRSVSRVGLASSNTNHFFHFLIRLHESGPVPFDVAFFRMTSNPPGIGALSATIGAQNATGTQGVMLNGSPNLDLSKAPAPPFAAKDVEVWQFKAGSQPANDVTITGFSLPTTVKTGSAHNVTGSLVNHGSAVVNSLEITFQANNGMQYKFNATPPAGGLQPNESFNFFHSSPYIAGMTAGTYDNVKMWASKVNNVADALPDSGKQRPFINQGVRNGKKVLFEEYSTAPCQFCPDAVSYIDRIIANNPNEVIVAQHHAGFGTDAMTIPAHSTYAAAFASGAPTATTDRIAFDGEGSVGTSRSRWESDVTNAKSEGNAPVLNVETYFNLANRLLTVRCTTSYQDYARPGDLRLTLFLIESEVVGTGSGYNQVNAYNGTAGHPFYMAGNPIIGYKHKYVTRHVFTDTWGDQLSVVPMPGSTPQVSEYIYVVPASFDWQELSVAGFVSYYNDSDVRARRILNANDSKVWVRGVGIEQDLIAEGFSASVFPNPVTDHATLQFKLSEVADMDISIVDMMGRTVNTVAGQAFSAGTHELSLNAAELSKGMYFVRFSTGKGVYTHKFSVE